MIISLIILVFLIAAIFYWRKLKLRNEKKSEEAQEPSDDIYPLF